MSNTSTYITVSELTFAVKTQLETNFSHLAIQGEISNAKLHSSGHLYFDLKDATAKISAVMFRPQVQQLMRPPKEGDEIIAKGALTVYPPHGKYQMLVRSLDYLGVGDLLLKLEALKKKLHTLGWFDKTKKKPLPKFPRTIGVVTSPTGAVIRDIIHVLSRRFSGFHLILNPVKVQGNEASYEIVKAIEDFNRYQIADVLIVGRGGGSLEDLWAFNEERVAKAIFESSIPIISAVGHETDVTIADFVADMRAPTPSAAAEIVMAEKAHHLEFLQKTKKNLLITLSQRVRVVKAQLKSYQQQAAALKPTSRLLILKNQMHQFEKRVNDCMLNAVKMKKFKLHEMLQKLKAVDPKNVLKRGYCILFAEKEGSAIVSTQKLHVGQDLKALFSDGAAKLIVKSIDNHEPEKER